MTDVSKPDYPPFDVSEQSTATADVSEQQTLPFFDIIPEEISIDVATETIEVDVIVEGPSPIEAVAGPNVFIEADALGSVQGPPGPMGPQGPQGPPGEGMGVDAVSYRHIQAQPANVWIIANPLPFRPNISVVDSTGQEIWPGEVIYSASQIQLAFSSSVGGEAYLT